MKVGRTVPVVGILLCGCCGPGYYHGQPRPTDSFFKHACWQMHQRAPMSTVKEFRGEVWVDGERYQIKIKER